MGLRFFQVACMFLPVACMFLQVACMFLQVACMFLQVACMCLQVKGAHTVVLKFAGEGKAPDRTRCR